MSNRKSDVKDGKSPARAKPLRTQIKFKFDAQPRNSTMGGAVKVVGLKDLPAAERRVQVAAARLRVTLDERLDRRTPPEVQALAKEPL